MAQRGIIRKWLRNFGVIEPVAGSDPRVIVHSTDLPAAFRAGSPFRAGLEVEYEWTDTPKGRHATQVRVIR
ncbi:cold shock CspA family protein [Bradyrhizobium sp. USDA 4341]